MKTSSSCQKKKKNKFIKNPNRKRKINHDREKREDKKRRKRFGI